MRWLLLPTLCLAAHVGRAQTAPALPPDQARLEAYYRLTYRPDSADATTRTELTRLTLGSQLSRFDTSNALFLDSTMTATMAAMTLAQQRGETPTINIDNPDRSRFSSFFRGVLCKIPTAKETVVYDRIGSTRYVYEEPTPLIWSILPATATVAGYACQRATTTFGGRQWEAWFTRAVPVSDGPYKFYGLPGLIVKVGDLRQHYVFELAQLRKLPAPVVIALPEAGAKPIAKADFVRGKAEYERSSMEQLLASGNIRFRSPAEAEAAKLKARERAKRKNNPLELR